MSVTYSAYPDESVLMARINDLGIIAESTILGFDLSAKIATAISDWEYATGHQPFLAASSNSTRYFDPPRDGRLTFDTGLASFTSLTLSGTTLTSGTDFYLGPQNASARSIPYEWADFGSNPGGLPRSIAITGRWGYATTLPPIAWEAIISRALLLAQPEMALGISKGVYSIRDDTFDVRYGGGGVTPLQTEAKIWADNYRSAVRRMQRIAI